MALHDAVFDSLVFDSRRNLRLYFTELPGRPLAERLVISVSKFQAVVIIGVMEEDWFLSGVYCYSGDGAVLDPLALKGQPIGRLVIMGTDGSSIEVMLGEARSWIEAGPSQMES